MRFIIFVFLVYLTIIIQAAVIPALGLAHLNFHLDLILVVAMGIYLKKLEILIWPALLGFAVDYLTTFSWNIMVFLFPLLAYLAKFLLQKFWGKPGIWPFVFFVAILSFLYQLSIYGMELNFFTGEIKAGEFILENRYLYGMGLLKSVFINGLLIAPFYYLMFNRIS